MRSSASAVDASASMHTGSFVIHIDTGWRAASKSLARARTMSRSVKIPARSSVSITRTEPTCRTDISCAASATVAESETTVRSELMTSRNVTMPAEPSLPVGAAEALLGWYRPRRRAFAWRRTRDPYAIWVSEVMLQQTQAARVEPRFRAFLRRFPTVSALAGASRADVVRAWDGLGYHRRAVSLHEAARAVVRDHAGRLPRAAATLRTLPGIGPYTAAAVASIAFGEPVPALDVNATRIVARAVLGAEPDEVGGAELRAAAARVLPPAQPGAWNQALMDLGREACRPSPRCSTCPLQPWCRFAATERTGRGAGRRQPPFEGSVRQARGRIVAALRQEPSISVRGLAGRLGVDPAGVDAALDGLARDGIVVAARGRVRLAT